MSLCASRTIFLHRIVLKSLRFFLYAMTQKRGRDLAANDSVLPREVDNRNHFVP
jgi:hypothetical protein